MMNMTHAMLKTSALAMVLLASAATARADDLPAAEREKIEKLITFVGEMKDAQFVRKGTAYSCEAAAKFMRGKWEWKSDEIKCAADFVKICSAGGSGTGTPYLIRHKDGKEEKAAEVLTNELKRLEVPAASN